MSLKSDDNTQIDFSDKQYRTGKKIAIDNSVRYVPKSEQTKEKSIDKYKNSNPLILFNIFIGKHDRRCYTDESIAEAKAILDELGRVHAITCKQNDIHLDIGLGK